MAETSPDFGAVKTSRVEALSDGVFAIVMTILVIELFAPGLEEANTPEELASTLLHLGPTIFAYVLSFVALGIFWISHHFQFHYIQRTNRTLLWLNLLLLMTVSTIPFSAALLGAHMLERLAIVVYGANLIGAGVFLFLHWWYATTERHHLLRHGTPPGLVLLAKRRILLPSACYLVTIGVAFVSPLAALVLFALVPVLHIMPSAIDAHWAHKPEPPAKG